MCHVRIWSNSHQISSILGGIINMSQTRFCCFRLSLKQMAEKVFHLQPWTLQVQTVAQKLIGEIRSITPELEVLFMGAAALGLPGKNDIDLDVLCDAREVGR